MKRLPLKSLWGGVEDALFVYFENGTRGFHKEEGGSGVKEYALSN